MADIAKGRSRFVRPAAMLAASIVMLTLAFAPVGQFYLAWVGLAPWLIWLAESRSRKSAFFWSWIAGTLFFIANMWWMAIISWPGMLALLIFCGLFWAVAALIIRGAGFLHEGSSGRILSGVLGIAVVWTATEWVRGIIFTGLPWLFLGYSQTPILPVCQIADITGAYGVTFWVMAINALAAIAWLNRHRLRIVIRAAAIVGTMTLAILVYGLFRIGQTNRCLSPGPTIAVVQSNYPQTNSGEKGAKIDQRLDFNVRQTLAALNKSPGKIDMVVWSETMMEGLNTTARLEVPTYQDVYDVLSRLTRDNDVALLTGGEYYANWQDEVREGETYRVPEDRRNTAYFFDQDGREDDSLGHRYDKIHLVPWGEFIPGKDSMPFLYKLSVTLGPRYYSDYIMQPGETLTVFNLQGDGKDWRFVTPICFEDIDARLCSEMFRPANDGKKRADFMVNLTNDGWFKGSENADHLQAASFRSIENRAWTARSVNTGISGFIDSVGDCSDLLPVREPGTSVRQIMIDARLTFYTKFGDVFAYMCDAFAVGIAIFAWWRLRVPQVKKEES
jgi:apolipoprotein N-acyltransferase